MLMHAEIIELMENFTVHMITTETKEEIYCTQYECHYLSMFVFT